MQARTDRILTAKDLNLIPRAPEPHEERMKESAPILRRQFLGCKDETLLGICVQGYCPIYPILDTEKKTKEAEKSRAGSGLHRMVPTQEASGQTVKRITEKWTESLRKSGKGKLKGH